MTNETFKKIVETTEGKEFIDFITREVYKLNTIDNLQLNNLTDSNEIATEIKARLRAIEVLKEILTPLIMARDYPIIKSIAKEYVI